MDIPIKSHQFTSHFIPGLIVVMFLVFLSLGWKYESFIAKLANQGAVVTANQGSTTKLANQGAVVTANQGSTNGSTITELLGVLLLSVAAFIIGEFIDGCRDILEHLWDNIADPNKWKRLDECKLRKWFQKFIPKVEWEYLFKNTPEMRIKRDAYWTYYVLCCNTVLSILFCFIIYMYQLFFITCSFTYWLAAVLVASVYLIDAIFLREEISTFTKEEQTKDKNEKQVST